MTDQTIAHLQAENRALAAQLRESSRECCGRIEIRNWEQ